MCYDFEIAHRPGCHNIADYLSRHPVVTDMKQKDEILCFLVDHAVPRAVSKADIAKVAREKSLATTE